MESQPIVNAWMDESMRHRGQFGRDQSIYILAATVADQQQCGSIRESLRRLKLGNSPKLHWKEENSARRIAIASAVARLPIMHAVVIGTPLDVSKQERARRKCMERLFFELERLGVSHIIGESRTQSLNMRDVRMLDSLRSQQMIPSHLRLDFARPSEEPMLWLPDVIAGVVGDERMEIAEYHDVRHSIELHQVTI